MVREGKTGQQKIIGYAASREEALILLAKYNHAPWDIEGSKITLGELYQLWLEKRAEKLGTSNRSGLKAAYQHCISLADHAYKSIRSYQMQECIDNSDCGSAMQSKIKNLWTHLDRFALELDIVEKTYSILLHTDSMSETSRLPFTEEEIMRCWENKDIPWVDSILFLLYSGWRFSEMLGLKIENINWPEKTMIGGVKTEAGKNRIVPISTKIQPMVEKRLAESKAGYLFELQGAPISGSAYRSEWKNLMKRLGMNHVPHECRHTFRSRLDSAGANKTCIDRLMGHKSIGIGERVYTHKTIEELRVAIEKLN